MKQLDLDSWNRRAHFHTFKDFADPFFNICADVDVTVLKRYADQRGVSFFLLSYFYVLKAVNSIPEFAYRIRDNTVVIHDTIHGNCTVLNEDDTFSYGDFDYFSAFADFQANAEAVIASLKRRPVLAPTPGRDDVIHSSVIPWVHFTSFEHAKRFDLQDSIPKIALGKYTPTSGQLTMPISVSVHHALMDGIHVGRLFATYQSLIDNPQTT